MSKGSKKFNARKSRTGNIMVKHNMNGKNVFFWVILETGEVNVERKDGALVDDKEWGYMCRKGEKVNYPVTAKIVEKYRNAVKLFSSGKKQVAKFNNRKKKAVKTSVKKQKKVNNNLKTTFGDIKSLQALKEAMAV